MALPIDFGRLGSNTAGCYGCHGDWRKLIYWLSAAVLTASVTF